MVYTVGEAAQKLDLTASALRYYDKEGLLPFLDRSAGGIRMFQESDLEWLRLIECLKSTGMPIKDIKRFMDWYGEGDSSVEKRRDLFHERRRVVLEQMEQLKNTLDLIEYKCWFYDTAAQNGTDSARNDVANGNMPERIREIRERLSFEKG